MAKYRLEPLLRIKARARKRAEIALAQAIGHLEKEKKRKEELEQEKQDLIDTKKEIRAELDAKMGGGVVADSFRYIDYMRSLEEDVLQKDRDIERQEDVIEDAKVVVGRARRDYIDAAQEHKVMEKHKELWEKKLKKVATQREQKEMDELGQVIHQMADRRASGS